MPSRLASTHIREQARLRELVTERVGRAWVSLRGYDRVDVPRFLAVTLPIVEAAQRRSVAVTDAYLAAAVGRAPFGVDQRKLIGAAVRNGAAPREVYERPFVTVWTALKNGAMYEDAVHAGLARAQASAAMDVQLSMRATLQAVYLAQR